MTIAKTTALKPAWGPRLRRSTTEMTHRSAQATNYARALAVGIACLTAVSAATAQDDMDDVNIEAMRVADGVYMLTGQGGNIGLGVGADATFIIDDQFAPLTDKIVAAIATVTDRPVDYVLNTHWHYDHTGGNENFGTRGALIMAHDNVHKRMHAGQTMANGRVVDPAPKIALPVVTFNDSLTLRVNDQTITGHHVEHAHTDGDTIVFFREANVIHMGDTFFNGLYPFVDLSSGGNINGIIESAARALALGDADTQIIPGHGPLSNKRDLQRYHDMLVAIRDRVEKMMIEGMSLEDIQAAKPTADFDGSVNANGFIKPEVLVGFIHASLGS
ncbi:MAG: MBL fold metallo-hydrolase [Congregibacter sp.]